MRKIRNDEIVKIEDYEKLKAKAREVHIRIKENSKLARIMKNEE